MSASREKKQRQGGTPSDKTLTAKQQAEQTRRKTIQYTVTGVVVAVLVAALLIWNSGFFQARAAAVTVGGTRYTAAQASYFYRSSYAYRMAASYGQYIGYDTSKSPKSQSYSEEQTFHDYFLEAAMEDMSTITALYDAALADKENGVSRADVKDDVDASVESARQAAKQYGVSYGQYLKGVYGSYMTPSVFEDCLTRVMVASVYRNAHGDGLSYTNEQLQAYYDGHKDDLDTFQYSYLYFAAAAVETKDDDGNDIEMTSEEKQAKEALNLAEAKVKADDAAAAIRDGMSAADAVNELEPTGFEVDAETEGKSLTGVYSEWVKNASRKAGDVDVVESSASGYYVVVFGGRFLAEIPTADTRHILVQAETDSSTGISSDEQMDAAKAKAEDLLNQWKAGEATEASFAELANANSSDGGSNTKGGLYEKVYNGKFVTNYNDWLFDAGRQPGDTGVVENKGSYYGYHVVYYVKQNPDFFTWMAKAEESLSSEDTETWLNDLQAGYTAEQAGGAKYLGA